MDASTLLRLHSAAFLIALAGCSDPSPAAQADGTGTHGTSTGTGPLTTSDTTTAPLTTTGPMSSTTGSSTVDVESEGDTTTSSTTSSSTDPSEKYDLGDALDVGMADDGCQRIDMLFVVDNSGSMVDHQLTLIEHTPAFLEDIQTSLEDVEDIHVGVVTTDEYVPNVPECALLGGLVVSTGGTGSSDAVCGPYAAGGNYMTLDDDLMGAFSCAAQVGNGGDGLERPMNAMEAAVRGDHADPGACNEGFIRDDALLVVVIVTDEYDGPNDPDGFGSSGDANSWYETVVDAKGGVADNIVVLTLTYLESGACPPEFPFLDPGDIQTFAELFGDNGVLGCIDGDYPTTFTETTEVIANACEGFVPPE